MATRTTEVELYPPGVAAKRKLAVPTACPCWLTVKLPDCAAVDGGATARIRATRPTKPRTTQVRERLCITLLDLTQKIRKSCEKARNEYVDRCIGRRSWSLGEVYRSGQQRGEGQGRALRA